MPELRDIEDRGKSPHGFHLFVVNGIHRIRCYGEYKVGSSVGVAGLTDEDYHVEVVWAGDESEPETWEEVIKLLWPWSKENGIWIEELTAD